MICNKKALLFGFQNLFRKSLGKINIFGLHTIYDSKQSIVHKLNYFQLALTRREYCSSLCVKQVACRIPICHHNFQFHTSSKEFLSAQRHYSGVLSSICTFNSLSGYTVTVKASTSVYCNPSCYQLNQFRSIRLKMASAQKIKRTTNDIIKSEEDKRQYRGIELTNGFKALLISDPHTDKSSAALDVNIGFLSDPDDLPGLAHFCEHMLFLGTEKYKEENEYSKFLSEHGGSSNAFTSGENTNFYFDVAPEHLSGTLDRFAQFFIAPLFTESCTSREVNAVNSENDKNLVSDSWRLHMLERSLGNPNHAFAKFGTGNKDTLEVLPLQRNQDVRGELLNFHSKYYSANIMSLAVLGKESLDELSDMVVELFGDVINKEVSVPEWNDHPYGPEQVKKICSVVPIKDLRSLSVTWPIPDQRIHYKTSPGHYLGHLIGHEGPGSLLSELKKQGWVNTLVGGEHAGAKGFMFFAVNVDLTEDGIEHVNEIVTLIFQYIHLLREEGPQEWIFRECENLSKMSFRFKDKETPMTYTCSCASLLQEFPMKEILSAGYFHTEYKPELIADILDRLTPDNVVLTVAGQKFEPITNLTEKWYGTKYHVQDVSDDVIQKWKTVELHESLHLPHKNDFIPTNFDIVKRDDEPSSVPVMLRDTKMTRLWYRQDDKFLLPKACITISFISPYAFLDPLSTNMTYMFSALLSDVLTEYTYDADLAGLRYDLHSTIYGLMLSVRGYNDKQHVFLEKLLDRMTSLEINPQRFEILRENFVRSLKNFRAEQPHQQAVYYTNMLTAEVQWTKEEMLEASDDLTLDRMKAFVPRLFSELYIEMLVYGNVTRERTNTLADIVEKTLIDRCKTRPLLASQQRRYREVQLRDGSSFLYRRTNEVHKSSSLEVYLQCNVQETHANMVLELFCQIIGEPCFDILRTQEQLGYIVFSGMRRSNGVQGVLVLVQSDRNPAYVETRVEAFLHGMQNYILEMSDEQFQKHVSALASKRLEKPKKLAAQNMRYVNEITSKQYNFERDEIEVQHLKSLTKDDVITFYKDLIAHDAPRRHKLSVHIISTSNGTDAEDGSVDRSEPIDNVEPANRTDGNKLADSVARMSEITDVISFKRELGLFPLPKPYIAIEKSNKCKL